VLSKQNLLENDLINLVTSAAFLSKVKHPSLLSLYGICLEPNKTCLVVEYMSKGNLSALLRGKTTPSFSQMIGIAKNIVRGMEYLSHFPDPCMYMNHIFKSHDILVSHNWEVKVSDFGQIFVKDLAGTVSSLSSVAWTAPEILEGLDPHPKSAVYSFAMILWELYTRKVPVKKENPLKLLENCWSPNPEQRPSWPEIGEHLGRLLPLQKATLKALAHATYILLNFP